MFTAILRRLDDLAAAQTVKSWYSVEEFARLVSREPFTVREWCRLSRINADKSQTKTGSSQAWTIRHEEYLRFQRDGLLPR